MLSTNHSIDPEELMALVDGELGRDRSAEVEGHVRECLECQEVLGELRSVSARLAEWEVKESAEGNRTLPPRIEKKLTGRNRFQLGLFGYRWLAAGAVAVLLVFSSARWFTVARHHGADEAMLLRPQPQMAMTAAPPPPGTPQLQAAPQALMTRDRVSEREAAGPMIVRNTEISLTTRDFGNYRSAVEGMVSRFGGYFGAISVNAPESGGRTLEATIRVPATHLDGLMAELRKTGKVIRESQKGRDVTKEYVDLEARLRNARNTEQRLIAIERDKTGKLADVLSVENEISRVRGEIEQTEGERKSLAMRVELGTVYLTVTEEFKAQLQVVPESIGGRLRNAAVEGYRTAAETAIEIGEMVLAWGPRMIFLALVMWWPGRMLWRRYRGAED